MVEIYDSDREQVEAIRQWWKENGKTVLTGLALGLAAVFGWTGWKNYQTGRTEAASALYQNQTDALARGDYDDVDSYGRQLLEDFEGSGYAPLAALILAKAAFEDGRAAEARRQLQWVLEHSKREEVRLLARLRLARLMLSEGDLDGALAMLSVSSAGAFESQYQELRGDILVAKSDPSGAKQAYRQALEASERGRVDRVRVQMKLDDLGHFNSPPA